MIQNVLRQVFELVFKADVICRNPTDGALTEFKRKVTTPKKKALTLAEQARFAKKITVTQKTALNKP